MRTSHATTALLLAFAIGCSDSGELVRDAPQQIADSPNRQPATESSIRTHRLNADASEQSADAVSDCELPAPDAIGIRPALTRIQIDHIVSGTGQFSGLWKVLTEFDLAAISDSDYEYLVALTTDLSASERAKQRTLLIKTGMIIAAGVSGLCPLVQASLSHHVADWYDDIRLPIRLITLKVAVQLSRTLGIQLLENWDPELAAVSDVA